MNMLYRIPVATMIVLVASLTACGGGGGGGGGVADVTAGIGGTGKIASGPITAFGSIYVNDVKYETDNATIEINDVSGQTQAELAIGMVVTVTGTVNDDGITGTADTVVFDNEVEGPVSDLVDDGNTRRFTVLGTMVVADSTTTSFDDGTSSFGFDNLANGLVVEVSGFRDGTGAILATYIEKQADSFVPDQTEVELKGVVSSAGPGSFQLDGMRVDFEAADLEDLPSGISDGMSVEVEGVLASVTVITATRIEAYSEGLGDEVDDASIEGLITDFQSNSSFKVNGQLVDASSATIEPGSVALRDGLRIEAEGPVTAGTLIADEIEIHSGDIDIEARVSSVSPADSTVTLSFGAAAIGSITVTVNNATELEDDIGDSSSFSLDDIEGGDFLKIRGLDDGGGAIIASKIKREEVGDTILQGPLDSFVSGASVTVLGVIFSTDMDTEFDDDGENKLSGAADFFVIVDIGDIIKVTDEDGDGIADEIDQEDD